MNLTYILTRLDGSVELMENVHFGNTAYERSTLQVQMKDYQHYLTLSIL